MTKREAFIASIKDNPHDDLTRMVFADYLDENDESELAEFIRLQCRLAALKILRGQEDDVAWAMTMRMIELIKDLPCVPEEIGDCPRSKERPLDNGRLAVEYEHPSGGINPSIVFHRGFIMEVNVPYYYWAGGVCNNCGGGGRILQHWDPASDTMRGGRTCPQCAGEGKFLPHGQQLMQEHPIMSLRLTPHEVFTVYASDLAGQV